MSVSPTNAANKSKFEAAARTEADEIKRATRSREDTLEMHEEAESTTCALSACLQGCISGILSCITGFFSWIASWFTTPGYTDPELLAHPLKQIEKDLGPWQASDSYPLRTLMDKMRETSEGSSFSWALHLEVYRGGQMEVFHSAKFDKQDSLPTHPSSNADVSKIYAACFQLFLKHAKEKFHNETYIDLKYDTVVLKLMGAIADPKTYSTGPGPLTFKNNFACVIQTWGESAQLTAYKRDNNFQPAGRTLWIREQQALPQDIQLLGMN